MIARALTTFRTDSALLPGRFNISEVKGVELILDYGHNEAAMKAFAEGIVALGTRRTVMVIGLPGDRRDSDLLATMEATLPFVDEWVLHDLGDRRGREVDELPKLLATRIPPDKKYLIVDNQHNAVFAAWKLCAPGDRLVIIADIVDETLETLRQLTDAINQDAECDHPLNNSKDEER
jgi:cyanophycin synthetase